MYRVYDRRPEVGTYITNHLKPDQECIATEGIRHAAPVKIYVQFAENIETIVVKFAEKKRMELQKLRDACRDQR